MTDTRLIRLARAVTYAEEMGLDTLDEEVAALRQEAVTRALDALDGLPHLHDIYDALVRYRAAIWLARDIEQAKGAER
jgi:hypothetical protein